MSRERRKTITCPKCGKESNYIIWDSLNGDLNPDAKRRLIEGTLFDYNCPHCGHQGNVDYEILYHDMTHHVMVYYVHEDSVEKTLGMFSNVEEKMGISMTGYRKRIVTNQNALREKAIIFENELDDRIIELIKLFYLANAQKQFPDANITEAFFWMDHGKYNLQLIGDQLLGAEISADLYKSLKNEYAEKFNAAVDNQCMIDIDWAYDLLEEEG